MSKLLGPIFCLLIGSAVGISLPVPAADPAPAPPVGDGFHPSAGGQERNRSASRNDARFQEILKREAQVDIPGLRRLHLGLAADPASAAFAARLPALRRGLMLSTVLMGRHLPAELKVEPNSPFSAGIAVGVTSDANWVAARRQLAGGEAAPESAELSAVVEFAKARRWHGTPLPQWDAPAPEWAWLSFSGPQEAFASLNVPGIKRRNEFAAVLAEGTLEYPRVLSVLAGDDQEALVPTVRRWAYREPLQALAWCASLPSGAAADACGREAGFIIGADHSHLIPKVLESKPAKAVKSGIIEGVNMRSGDAALELCASLSMEDTDLLGGILEQQAQSNPESAIHLLETLFPSMKDKEPGVQHWLTYRVLYELVKSAVEKSTSPAEMSRLFAALGQNRQLHFNAADLLARSAACSGNMELLTAAVAETVKLQGAENPVVRAYVLRINPAAEQALRSAGLVDDKNLPAIREYGKNFRGLGF